MPIGKRELIDTGTDKRYVRRDEKGRFEDVVDVGKNPLAGPQAPSEARGEARPG